MNKTEFISKVSESIGADTAQAASVVNTVLNTPVTVPERIVPVFKAGKRFRDAVKI